MNLNLLKYLNNTLTPLDRFKKFKSKNKLKIGWCGVFPPYQNGAAAVSYYIVRELLERKDIEVGLIPINNKINKKIFKDAIFCKLDDPELDTVIFWCLGSEFQKYASKCKTKKIAWQTIHHNLKMKTDYQQIKEIESSDLKIFMTKWAMKLDSKNKKDIRYLPFGVNTKIFKPHKKNDFEVIFVSRSHYYKGIMPFLDAIPSVIKKCPDIIFRLHAPFDKFSPYLEEIKENIRITKEKYPENFFFDMSWKDYDSMAKIYESASILVFPSNNEGFGVPLIEAMSCGIPCIVSNIPPLNEIITPKTGFLIPMIKKKEYHGFEFPDPKRIAEKIILLRTDKRLMRTMQIECQKHIKKNYELEDIINKLVMIIKDKKGRL